MVRRNKGSGGISYEASRNKFRASFNSPGGQLMLKRFDTKKEAEEWLTTTRAEVLKSTFVEPSIMTVGEWIETYINDYMAPRVRPTTLIREIQIAQHLGGLAKLKLQELNAVQVQKFYNNVDISANCKLKVHKLLKKAYKKAYVLELVPKNIMEAVDAPKYIKPEIDIFSQAEIGILLHYLQDDEVYQRYYSLIALAIATGARLGEILGLKLDCVQERSIIIKNSLTQIGSTLFDSLPKTKAGNRVVTISPQMASMLRRTAMEGDVLSVEGYVFHTSKGTPLAANNFERAWKIILHNAGIPYKHFHALRHTHATQLLANGVPLLEVSKRLGHSKASHTLELYGHAIKGYDLGLPEKIENIFFK